MSGYRAPEHVISLTLDEEIWQRLSEVLTLVGTAEHEVVLLEAIRRGLPELEREANVIAARSVTICPRCSHSPLEPRDVSAIRMQACLGCGGVWLDNVSAAALIESLDQDVRELALRAHENARTPGVDSSPELTCSVCSDPMQKRHFTTAKVRLDVCIVHGTWFDSFELVRMIDVLTECKKKKLELEASIQISNAEVARQLHELYQAEQRRRSF